MEHILPHAAVLGIPTEPEGGHMPDYPVLSTLAARHAALGKLRLQYPGVDIFTQEHPRGIDGAWVWRAQSPGGEGRLWSLMTDDLELFQRWLAEVTR